MAMDLLGGALQQLTYCLTHAQNIANKTDHFHRRQYDKTLQMF